MTDNKLSDDIPIELEVGEYYLTNTDKTVFIFASYGGYTDSTPQTLFRGYVCNPGYGSIYNWDVLGHWNWRQGCTESRPNALDIQAKVPYEIGRKVGEPITQDQINYWITLLYGNLPVIRRAVV